MDTTFRATLKRNKDIVTSIPKKLIRDAIKDIYTNPDDPKWEEPGFTFDDIILVPSVVPKKEKKKQSKKKA